MTVNNRAVIMVMLNPITVGMNYQDVRANWFSDDLSLRTNWFSDDLSMRAN